MESQVLSISKLFTERLFRIPDYQRGFAWNEKHIRDFWNDLVQLPIDKNHYVGVLTLEDVPKNKYEAWNDDLWIIVSKSYSPYYIVDGQQRLTTSIILIQSILEYLDDGLALNYTYKDDIRKKFIYESKDGGISKSYLFGYEKDNPSYEYLKIKILNDVSENSFSIEETSYTNNLEIAKNYFKVQLKELPISDVEVLYKKLTQNFLFNIYIISSDIDVFIAFETMNNRGKPLSHLELLKNRLIYISTLYQVDDYEKEKLRKNINECWMDIYKFLGKNKLKPLNDDEFLAAHFMLYFGKEIREKDTEDNEYEYYDYGMYLYNRRFSSFYKSYILEEKFIPKNIDRENGNQEGKITISYINEYVKSLKLSVKQWYYIFNPSGSDYDNNIISYLDKLNRIELNGGKSLVMVVLQKEHLENTILDFLKAFERYMFLVLLVGRIRYDDTYESLNVNELAEKLFYGEITTHDVLKRVIEVTNKMLYSKEFYKEVVDRFKRNGYYQWDGIRYFLYEYELYIKQKSKSDSDKIRWEDLCNRDFKSIEHIYPQRPRNTYWVERFGAYSNKQREILRDSLGNLVPISKAKNSSLSNKPFPEKVGNKDTSIGYMYGSYSEIELTHCSEWAPVEILNRGIKLLKFMEKRWGVKFDNKIDLLGLSFMKN